MSKPLDDERFKDLQRRADMALQGRPDMLATVQREIDEALPELRKAEIPIRTRPVRGDPVPSPDAPKAQMQIRVLEDWRAKIVYRRPSEALRERIDVAKRMRAQSGFSTTLQEIQSGSDLANLKALLVEIDDPSKLDTDWVNRVAERAFRVQEIAAVERLLADLLK